MSHSADTILRIIEIVESIYDRRQMYFMPVDAKTVTDVLRGFELGCFACGLPPQDIRRMIEAERGWDQDARQLIARMRERNMTDEAMVEELLTIEVETWKRFLLETQARQSSS